MLRPLVTAFIEYLLAFLVYKYGKLHRKVISAVLFFLASYQLGEVIIFATSGAELGFKVAYISTTLLPPLGVLLVEKILKRNFGYWFFQVLALAFCAYIIYIPNVALHYELGQFCVRIFSYEPILQNFWMYYYQATLMYAMIIMVIGIWKVKNLETRAVLQKILLGYLSFNGLTFVITYFFPWFQPSTASLMCALALVAAFIFSRVSLAENYKEMLVKTIHNFRIPN